MLSWEVYCHLHQALHAWQLLLRHVELKNASNVPKNPSGIVHLHVWHLVYHLIEAGQAHPRTTGHGKDFPRHHFEPPQLGVGKRQDVDTRGLVDVFHNFVQVLNWDAAVLEGLLFRGPASVDRFELQHVPRVRLHVPLAPTVVDLFPSNQGFFQRRVQGEGPCVCVPSPLI